MIHAGGAKAGISLKPGTAFSELEPWLDQIDLLLVMTVEPGFGGQAFMYEQVKKVPWPQYWHGEALPVRDFVDGGISPDTVMQPAAAGAPRSGGRQFHFRFRTIRMG
jgi:ribulose-phosphate 3-epimerase